MITDIEKKTARLRAICRASNVVNAGSGVGRLFDAITDAYEREELQNLERDPNGRKPYEQWFVK